MRSALRLGLTLALFASVAITAACGGSTTPSSTAPPAQATGNDKPVNPPPAAALEPTATPGRPYDFSLITPVPPSESAPHEDALLGTSDRFAAKSITQALTAQGFDLNGIEFFVFPLPSGAHNMLVIDRQLVLEAEISAADETTADVAADPMLVGLATSEAFESANLGRIVYNLHYLDDQGAEVLLAILTMPGDTFVASVTGALTQEEALAETNIEITQVAPQ
jgi:hypothetical protein